MNKTAIFFFGLIVTCLVFTAYYLSMNQEERLRIEDLAECLNIAPDEGFRAEAQLFLNTFSGADFSHGYNKVYQQLSTHQDESNSIKKAAVAALLIASQNFSPSLENRNIAMRLVIRYLTDFHLSTDSALAWKNLGIKYNFFSSDETNALLFRQYLRKVWVKEVKSNITEQTMSEAKSRKFLQFFPEFADETRQLLIEPAKPEKEWKYVLIEGRSGENEEDYELKEVSEP